MDTVLEMEAPAAAAEDAGLAVPAHTTPPANSSHCKLPPPPLSVEAELE